MAHRRRWLRVLTGIGAGLVALYVSGCALMYSSQRKVIFPAPEKALSPSYEGGELVRVQVANEDVREAVAYHVPARAGRPTVVHFHGNGEQIANTLWLADALAHSGIGFYAIEYPGYGLAPGEVSEENIYAAAQAALDELVNQRGVKREDLVVMGQSIGTGVATEMAARGFGTKLVLVSPYTSLADVAATKVSWLPVRLLLKDKFESADKAPKIPVPVLIIHGTQDQVIPYELGNTLATKFAHAELVSVDGAGHNDVLHEPAVVQRLVEFVGK